MYEDARQTDSEDEVDSDEECVEVETGTRAPAVFVSKRHPEPPVPGEPSSVDDSNSLAPQPYTEPSTNPNPEEQSANIPSYPKLDEPVATSGEDTSAIPADSLPSSNSSGFFGWIASWFTSSPSPTPAPSISDVPEADQPTAPVQSTTQMNSNQTQIQQTPTPATKPPATTSSKPSQVQSSSAPSTAPHTGAAPPPPTQVTNYIFVTDKDSAMPMLLGVIGQISPSGLPPGQLAQSFATPAAYPSRLGGAPSSMYPGYPSSAQFPGAPPLAPNQFSTNNPGFVVPSYPAGPAPSSFAPPPPPPPSSAGGAPPPPPPPGMPAPPSLDSPSSPAPPPAPSATASTSSDTSSQPSVPAQSRAAPKILTAEERKQIAKQERLAREAKERKTAWLKEMVALVNMCTKLSDNPKREAIEFWTEWYDSHAERAQLLTKFYFPLLRGIPKQFHLIEDVLEFWEQSLWEQVKEELKLEEAAISQLRAKRCIAICDSEEKWFRAKTEDISGERSTLLMTSFKFCKDTVEGERQRSGQEKLQQELGQALLNRRAANDADEAPEELDE